MMDERTFGNPALTLSGLRMWVHKRERPESMDAWDGNWLDVTVRVKESGAQVWVGGAILTTMALGAWRDECTKLYEGTTDSASLSPMEPYLDLIIRKVDSAGHLEMHIDITPDYDNQNHTFRIHIDQSYLPGLISELDTILAEYPVR